MLAHASPSAFPSLSGAKKHPLLVHTCPGASPHQFAAVTHKSGFACFEHAGHHRRCLTKQPNCSTGSQAHSQPMLTMNDYRTPLAVLCALAQQVSTSTASPCSVCAWNKQSRHFACTPARPCPAGGCTSGGTWARGAGRTGHARLCGGSVACAQSRKGVKQGFQG